MAGNEQFLIRILAQDSTRRAFQSVNRGLGGISTAAASFRLGSTAAFAAVAAGAIVLNKELLNTQLQFTAIQKTLDFATGGVTAGAEAFEFATEQSRRLGQDVSVTAQAFAQFAAAAKGTTLEGKKAEEIFTAISEAAAVLQLDSYSTRGALRALEQMISKGNVQAEELRQQLGERFPGAFKLAADAMEVSTQKLNDMLENGEVLADELLPKLARVITEQYGDSLPSAMNSLNASVGRLNTEWSLFKKNLAENMPYKEALDFLTSLLRLSNDMVEASKQPLDVSVGGEAQTQMAALKGELGELKEAIAKAQAQAQSPMRIALFDLFGGDKVGELLMQYNTVEAELEALAIAVEQEYKRIGESVGDMVGDVFENEKEPLEDLTELLDALAGSANSAGVALSGLNFDEIIPKTISFEDPLQGLEDLLKDLDKRRKEAVSMAEGVIARGLTEEQALRKEIEELNKAFSDKDIGPDVYSQALRVLASELANLNPNIEEAEDLFDSLSSTISANLSPSEKYAENVREFVEQALRLQEIDPEAFKELGGMEAIQKAVAGMAEGFKGEGEKGKGGPFESLIGEMDIVFNRWDEGMDGMVDAFARALQEMAAKALAEQLTSSLGGLFGAKDGGGGGILSAIGGFFGGGKARGGTVMSNRAYLVGEKGPELLYAGRSGTIVPNDRMGGGGLNYAPVVNISGGASEQDRAIFSAELRRQKAEIADMLARRRF
jgi:tape measure domain-containing protein